MECADLQALLCTPIVKRVGHKPMSDISLLPMLGCRTSHDQATAPTPSPNESTFRNDEPSEPNGAASWELGNPYGSAAAFAPFGRVRPGAASIPGALRTRAGRSRCLCSDIGGRSAS